MNDPVFSRLPSDPVEQAAAEWVMRCDRGLTPDEQDEYLLWMAADARHGAALARHRRNWERLNLLAQWRPEHAPRPNRDLLAPPAHAGAGEDAPARGWRRLALPLAVAGAVLLSLHHLVPVAERSGANADTGGAAVAELKLVSQTLADGSRIELKAGARLDVYYTATERRVWLQRGEAHFKVVTDAARPFRVEAAGVRVEAVGTAFSVSIDDTAIEVLVTEGRVRVDDVATGESRLGLDVAGAPRLLLAGQSGRIGAGRIEPAVIRDVPYAEMVERLAWQPRLLDFSGITLQQVVDELNRRPGGLRLVIEDAGLAELEISAAMRWHDVEELLRVLEAKFIVEAERGADAIVLRRGKFARLHPLR
jgi:transmembrane sensor